MNAKSEDARLQEAVAAGFAKHFGRTSLEDRLADVQRQTEKLNRFPDARSLQDAAGDLLCAVMQLANEQGWSASSLVDQSLRRIDRRREIYARLGRRMRVAILCGAFDPIHRGHVEMSKITLASQVVDEVWWMPCYAHLAGKRMESPRHRLAMCTAAAKEVPGVEVFDFEIRHRFLGDTYHLAKKLIADESIQSRCVLHLLFGRDNAESMHSWANFEGLRRMMPTIVVPHGRMGQSSADAWYRQKPHCLLETAAPLDTSSTEVRRRLSFDDPSAQEVLPGSVYQYIQDHGLYQSRAKATIPLGSTRRVAVMVGSFDPPTTAQVRLTEMLLSSGYHRVRICPASQVRSGVVIEHAEPVHRAALIDLTFGGRPRVEIDFRGLQDERTVAPASLHRESGDDEDPWFVVPAESVAGQSEGSDLRNAWQEGQRLWRHAGFVIVTSAGQTLATDDLPPRHEIVSLQGIRPPAELRELLSDAQDVSEFLPDVAGRYIARHRLFQSVRYQTHWPVSWSHPKVRIVYDGRNENASRLAERYRPWEDSDADFILVIGGDGTMLHAIRQHWRLRLPFVGMNAGHLGFLMNRQPFDSLDSLPLISYRMPMLRTLVETVGGEMNEHLAFSDAWIERQTGQAAWFRLDIDGQTRVPKIVGDGLLVATPSGSSSYARAMGATPMPLDTQSLAIAGSNIFRPRFWQPLMMPATATIEVSTLDHSGKRPVEAFVDGEPAGPARSMHVRRSNIAAVELAFTRDSDLASKLLASLLPQESDVF